MLGSTFTITLDGSGGVAKVLQLINQDNYSAEYRLDDTTTIYTAKVRHSSDNVSAGASPRDRHSVTITQFLKPTTTYPLGLDKTVVYTILNNPNDTDVSGIIDLSEAMSFYMVKAGGIAAKLLNKES